MDSDRQHAETLETVRQTAREQVPYNVQRVRPYLGLSYMTTHTCHSTSTSSASRWRVRFACCSVKLASFVRRSAIFNSKCLTHPSDLSHLLKAFSELGCLMCMRSKYGPGGEFDPDWYDCLSRFVLGLSHVCIPARKPDVGPCARGPPPPPGGPLPPLAEEQPPPVKPAWRNVPPPAPPKLSKRQRRLQREAEEAAARAATPADTRTIASWSTWQREYLILLFRMVVYLNDHAPQPIPNGCPARLPKKQSSMCRKDPQVSLGLGPRASPTWIQNHRLFIHHDILQFTFTTSFRNPIHVMPFMLISMHFPFLVRTLTQI